MGGAFEALSDGAVWYEAINETEKYPNVLDFQAAARIAIRVHICATEGKWQRNNLYLRFRRTYDWLVLKSRSSSSLSWWPMRAPLVSYGGLSESVGRLKTARCSIDFVTIKVFAN